MRVEVGVDCGATVLPAIAPAQQVYIFLAIRVLHCAGVICFKVVYNNKHVIVIMGVVRQLAIRDYNFPGNAMSGNFVDILNNDYKLAV